MTDGKDHAFLSAWPNVVELVPRQSLGDAHGFWVGPVEFMGLILWARLYLDHQIIWCCLSSDMKQFILDLPSVLMLVVIFCDQRWVCLVSLVVNITIEVILVKVKYFTANFS